jgi:Xaa-Pro aminopeptidase
VLNSRITQLILRECLALDKLTKRQFEIIDAVAEVQNYAFSAIKPGVVMKDFELDVEEYMGKVSKES